MQQVARFADTSFAANIRQSPPYIRCLSQIQMKVYIFSFFPYPFQLNSSALDGNKIHSNCTFMRWFCVVCVYIYLNQRSLENDYFHAI